MPIFDFARLVEAVASRDRNFRSKYLINQNQTLYLYGAQITPDEIKALLLAVELNPDIRTINLCRNPIEDAGVQSLAEFLKKNDTVRAINLGHCHVTSRGAKELADALKTNTSLESLVLSNNQIKYDGIKYLLEVVQQSKTTTEIDVRNNPAEFQILRKLSEQTEINREENQKEIRRRAILERREEEHRKQQQEERARIEREQDDLRRRQEYERENIRRENNINPVSGERSSGTKSGIKGARDKLRNNQILEITTEEKWQLFAEIEGLNELENVDGENCIRLDNAYRVLGITQDSSQHEIKAAYKNIMKVVHPDRNSDPKTSPFATSASNIVTNSFNKITTTHR